MDLWSPKHNTVVSYVGVVVDSIDGRTSQTWVARRGDVQACADDLKSALECRSLVISTIENLRSGPRGPLLIFRETTTSV